MSATAPFDLLRPGRTILGVSAVLLPFGQDGRPDEAAFVTLIERTLEAGLVPAVNMDTGYGGWLSPEDRHRLLTLATNVAGQAAGRDASLLSGSYVEDRPGDPWAPGPAIAAAEAVAAQGAIPVIFPSYGLASLATHELVEAFRLIGDHCEHFVAFELGEMFSPAGTIWDLDTYSAVMAIPSCIGAKHSSLRREPE